MTDTAAPPESGPESGPDPSPALRRLADALAAGERRALARAITLIESRRPEHRAAAAALLQALLPHTGRAVRLGISGAPGVGKSSFIEAFGLHLVEAGHRVAVLAVDPSSRRTGGSILGDKTRMTILSRSPAAFIRPSPAGTTLGGVARRTRESLLAAEAAGFDVVLVETVGVGQSETAVADMVDMMVLLLPPVGGDELQGIKKGIVELADLILVTKADGELLPQAGRAAAEIRAALYLLRPRHETDGAAGGEAVSVRLCSAVSGRGIAEAWETISGWHAARRASGALAARRADQAGAWLWDEVSAELVERLRRHPAVRAALPALEEAVRSGRTLAPVAAAALLARFLGPGGEAA